MKQVHWGRNRTVALLCAGMFLALGILSPGTAHAQSDTPRSDLWVTNGQVNAIVRTPSTIYLGGSFTQVGPYTGGGVPIDAATGSPGPTFPKVNGTVNVTVSDGAGGWYIGGSFTLVGCVARNNIAHILSAGTVDLSFNPNAVGPVYALAVSGSTVYAGGGFGSIGGQTRSGIAALDATTGLATAWDPPTGGIALIAYALAVSGSTVYVGGFFTETGGQIRNNIAALDATTALATAWNPNSDDIVYALAVSGTTVYAGGSFTSIGGQSRNSIAALDATTGLATAWNPNANVGVRALAVSGSTVYAGGFFTTIGGQTRNRIAALDATTSLATAWNPNANSQVLTLAVSGSTIYAGGPYTSIGGQTRNYIAALDTTTGLATTWNPNASNQVLALAVSGSTVYAGGDFTIIGGQTRNRIAAFDATTGLASAWNPNANGGVNSLAVSGSTVYAGGGFTIIGGQTRNRIAALDATTGLAAAWNPNAGLNPGVTVLDLEVSGSTVYAGGNFTTIGGQSRNYIAALDAATGLATAWNPNANSQVLTFAVSGSTVYVGGNFLTIGGQTRNRIAALDATTALATAWNPIANGGVNSLTVSGSTVYAGGNFTTIGGQTRNRIAALDAATGLATTWNPNADSTVNALAVSGSKVYAGGNFTNIGGLTRNYIAALDTTSGLAITWNANANNAVYALAVSGSIVDVGGNFTSIGPCGGSSYIAEFSADTTPPNAITITPATTGPTNANSVSFTVSFDEAVQNFANPTDLVITHSGTASGGVTYSGGPTTFTVTVTGILGDGSFTIGVNTGSDVQDLAGNALASSVTSVAVLIDNTVPTITLSSAAAATVNGAITVNVVLSEVSVNFASGDITPTNATVSGFSGGGTAYSFTLTPIAGGVFSAQVNAGMFTDAATNGNTASNVLSRTADLTDPVFSNIYAVASSATAGEMVSINFESFDILQGNPTVTVNGNSASFGGTFLGAYYYLYTVTGADPLGAATIDIMGTDLAGNNGFASNNTALTIVAAPPSVPLAAWPGLVVLAAAGAMVLRRRKK